MSYTAGDQIKRALRLLGVLAEGETPSADEYADSLMALNQMLDSWSTERLSVFGTRDITGTWLADDSSIIIGINGSGDWGVNPSPLQIMDSSYYTVNNISYGISIVNEDQYNSIVLKGATSALPQVIFPNTILVSDANIQVKIWPVPTQDIEFHFICTKELPQVTSESDTLYFPQGYMRAFAYNLACELAPEFGVEPSKQVQRIAMTSKRDLKRINNPDDLLSMPASILPNLPSGNIYTGWQ